MSLEVLFVCFSIVIFSPDLFLNTQKYFYIEKKRLINCNKKCYHGDETKTERVLYIRNAIYWKMKIMFYYRLWPVTLFISIT